MRYRFSLQGMLWEMTIVQVFWWHDVLHNRLNGDPLIAPGETTTVDDVNETFTWNDRTKRWE